MATCLLFLLDGVSVGVSTESLSLGRCLSSLVELRFLEMILNDVRLVRFSLFFCSLFFFSVLFSIYFHIPVVLFCKNRSAG